MKDLLVQYLREICSSSMTLVAASELKESDAEELFDILQEYDLGDCMIFYLCKCPQFINRIKDDLQMKGYISPSFEDNVFRASYNLGYC